MTAYLAIVNGRPQRVTFPVRSAGFLQTYTGALPTSGFLLEFDGYWVALTLDSVRTIGNDQSGANIAQNWTQTLFTHLWNSYNNTQCPVFTASGTVANRQASAIADWSSNRRITLPDFRGRVILGAGTGGGGLTTRAKGATLGAETHTLTEPEMPSHIHPNSTLTLVGINRIGFQAGGSYQENSGNTGSAGGGQAHNNIQPSAVEHFLISAGAR